MCDDGWVTGITVTCLEGVSDELKPSGEIKPCSSSPALRTLTHEHTSLSLSVCCVTGLLLLKAPLWSSSAWQRPQRSPRPLSSCSEWHMTSLRGPWTLTGPFRALSVCWDSHELQTSVWMGGRHQDSLPHCLKADGSQKQWWKMFQKIDTDIITRLSGMFRSDRSVVA